MKHFKIEEFDCKETGENRMNPDFLQALDELREECGFPFVINSGFRSVKHSAEIKKDKPGWHTKGMAADIACTDSKQRFVLIDSAISMGFSGIGIAKTFIHVDMRGLEERIWVY